MLFLTLDIVCGSVKAVLMKVLIIFYSILDTPFCFHSQPGKIQFVFICIHVISVFLYNCSMIVIFRITSLKTEV